MNPLSSGGPIGVPDSNQWSDSSADKTLHQSEASFVKELAAGTTRQQTTEAKGAGASGFIKGGTNALNAIKGFVGGNARLSNLANLSKIRDAAK